MAASKESRCAEVPVPPSSASAATLPVIDRDTLLASAAHDIEFLGGLVELFLAESPGLLAQIRAGVRDGHAEPVERAAHTLRTALNSFGARRAWEAARQLETCGREARQCCRNTRAHGRLKI